MQHAIKVIFAASLHLFILNHEIQVADGHGRLMDPPARNAMWRFGYPTPVNFDDNQLWCGNAATLEMNGGKCGICGDNFADPQPREHEAGGKSALGLVVRRYLKSQTIDSEIELTANHRGYFEFKLCPVADSTKEVTQECLEEHRLQVLDQNDILQDRYVILSNDTMFSPRIQLPNNLTCSHCVLQWTYIAANTWGTCDNGTEAVGCGPQETFKNCADIAILTNDGGRPPAAQQVPPKNMVLVRDNLSGNLIPLIVRSQSCVGSGGSFENQPGIDEWCQENCMRYPPNCPEDKCKCIESCEAIGSFKNQSGSDAYCQDKCNRYRPDDCNKERCKCF